MDSYDIDNDALQNLFSGGTEVFIKSGANWTSYGIADANDTLTLVAIGNTLYERFVYEGQVLKTVYQLTDEEMAERLSQYYGDNTESVGAQYFLTRVITALDNGNVKISLTDISDEMREEMMLGDDGDMYIEIVFNANGEYVSIKSSATTTMIVDEAGTSATMTASVTMTYEYPAEPITITAPADADTYLSGN